MRTSSPRLLLSATLLALLAAAGPAGAGLSAGGNLGVSLTRSDQWVPGASDSHSFYQFSGALHLDASLFAPGTLDLGASASYLGYRADGGAASDAFNYQLRLSALAQTPVRIGAAASRATTDFTSDSDRTRVGSTRVDAVSGTVVIAPDSYPVLAGTVRNTSITNRFSDTAPVKSEVTSVNAEASQSVEALNYSLTYDTAWSSGDYAETNYQSHNGLLRAQAELAPNVTAHAAAAYNLRSPTLIAPTNPRLDSQSVSTWVQWAASTETTGGGGYSYFNSLFEAPGSELRQSLSHSVNAYAWHRLSSEFSFDLGASGSASQTRLGTTEQAGTGEQASGDVRWTRLVDRSTVGASLSGSLGLIQPGGAPNAATWSVAASADMSRPLATWFWGVSLGASRDENTGASRGSRTRVYGTLDATGSPLGWSFRGLLSTGYSRSESPLFGSNRSFNARFDSQANRNGFNLGLNAGITDDLAEVLVPGAPPASLLIPVNFNSQSRYATASATIPTVSQLFLGLVARYVSVTSPGRGTQWESGLSINASYYLGAFQFSLYDQVTTGGSGTGASGTQNLLFLSVSRSFGR